MASVQRVLRHGSSLDHGEAVSRDCVTFSCKHCNSGSNEAAIGDGLCHNGRRHVGDTWFPQSEWHSCPQCRDAYTRKFGLKRCFIFDYQDDIVPCRFCNGYGFFLVGPDGTPVPIKLPEEHWGAPRETQGDLRW